MPQESPRAVLLPQVSCPDPDPRTLRPSKPELLGKLTQPGFVKEDLPKAPVSVAQKIVAYRTRLARMMGRRYAGEQDPKNKKEPFKLDGPEEPLLDNMRYWDASYFHNWDADCSDLYDTSRRLAAAIGEMAKIIFSPDVELCGLWKYALCFRWPISCIVWNASKKEAENDIVYLTLRRNRVWADWIVDPSEIEALLGLWIWSLKEEPLIFDPTRPHETRIRNGRISGGDYWGDPFGVLRSAGPGMSFKPYDLRTTSYLNNSFTYRERESERAAVALITNLHLVNEARQRKGVR